MKYQYFELCQLAEYPNIEIKINTDLGKDYAEAEIYFDGIQVDTFDIKEIIRGIVEQHIYTMEEVKKMEIAKEKTKKKRLEKEKKNAVA
jgi:hypothetical protein